MAFRLTLNSDSKLLGIDLILFLYKLIITFKMGPLWEVQNLLMKVKEEERKYLLYIRSLLFQWFFFVYYIQQRTVFLFIFIH